ncbi:ABC transporter substrate-binding protein [Lampropedia cohaerens]|uniref:ABC transporter substrate-binding protein n=1 Tax=Lampropedia cohaerens TaxID=1610491 RepID=UPI000A07D549|nr:ABC transporter substrate-binding protein [Lampropedia cohaerens]
MNTLALPALASRLTRSALAAGVLAACQLAAHATEPVTVQLRWVAQAQFAGYYVAQAKGYYRALDLDVTIKPGGPDTSVAQVLAGGGADLIVDWMPTALAARERGVPLVNVAQSFARSGMQMTCRADSGVRSPADLKGKTVGVWYSGSEYPFLAWMAKLGLEVGADDGVKVLKQGYNVDPLLQKQADCISTMSYNEYWQVIDGGLTPEQLVVFSYADQGVSTLEDGLYAMEAKLQDPAYVERLGKFVAATNKGWKYAIENPDEAVDIILDADASGAQTAEHQRRMLVEVGKLIDLSTGGALAEADYQRTVDILLSGGSTPVITKAPEGAWTSVVTDAAQKYQ